MPPTLAAANSTISGRSVRKNSLVSGCRRRSNSSEVRVMSWLPSGSSALMSAAPTMPRCPATYTRRPRNRLCNRSRSPFNSAAPMLELTRLDEIGVNFDRCAHAQYTHTKQQPTPVVRLKHHTFHVLHRTSLHANQFPGFQSRIKLERFG